jgi:hypothetical protein
MQQKSIEIPIYKNLSLVDLEGEEWIDCIGYDGMYHVSNRGRVKSLARWRKRGTGYGITKEKILKLQVDKKSSSIRVSLCKESIGCLYIISRLVFFSFNYNIENLPEYYIIHKDNDYTNNELDNLKIGTLKDSANLTFNNGKWNHLKLGNPNVSSYRKENYVYENNIIVGLKCNNCNENKDILLFKKHRNVCKQCDIAYNNNRLFTKFTNTDFKTINVETKEEMIYNSNNRDDLLKIIAISTVFNKCKNKEICSPEKKDKYKFSPFTIEIIKKG